VSACRSIFAVLATELRSVADLRTLLLMMVGRELKGRYAGSVVGLAWAYAQPLLTMAAYYLMFDVVFKSRLSEGAPTRAVGAFLIVGMVPWMFFCESVSRAMASLVESAGLLQKNPLPVVLFPARAVLAAGAVYLPLILVLIPAYYSLHQGSGALLLLPVLLALQLLLMLLLGYLLAILAAAMRDVLQVVQFCLTVGIFASPVMFPASMFPASLRWVLWLNPMTAFVEAYQSILLRGALPPIDCWLAMGGWVLVIALVLDRALLYSREQLVDWL
jgi:lipopolysaccharide transport system permease protein